MERKGRGATPCHSTLIPDPKTDPIIIISSRKLTHLFLSSGLLISLSLGTLLALATVAGIGAGVTELAVDGTLDLGHGVTLDLGDGVAGGETVNGESGLNAGGEALSLALSEGSLDGLDVLSGGVELLELTALAGEEDQAGLVVLEAGNIGNQGLLGVVGTAVVDGDTNGRSELLGDAGLL